MDIPSREELTRLLVVARISKRMARDLRYVPEEIDHADERDFLAVTDRAHSQGVLLFEEYVVPFSVQRRAANSRGRVEAIICDICATWQRGTNSATLTLKKSSTVSISHLVCADLDCSLHVRDMTDVSKLSRAQLREHITVEARIDRLRQRLHEILTAVE